MAALLVLDEDLAHELRWAGDLLARLQLDFAHKEGTVEYNYTVAILVFTAKSVNGRVCTATHT